MTVKDMLSCLKDQQIDFDNDLYIPAYYGDGKHYGPCIYKVWTIDSGGQYKSEIEDEPDFTTLDLLLEIICPNISYLDYKRILCDLVKSDEYHYIDYYSSRTKRIKFIKLDDLYSFLFHKGYLGDI